MRLKAEGFDPVLLDVSKHASIMFAFEAVMQMTEGSLGALVNNAGYGLPGALEDISREALREQYEVNVFGLMELTSLCIPGFRSQGAGRIVNVSSVLGRISMPFNAAYSSTKFAVEALSDALRVELDGTGIGVSLIEPGPIATQFAFNSVNCFRQSVPFSASRFGEQYESQSRQQERQTEKPGRFTLPPSAVATRILHALTARRPRRRYKVTVPAHIGAFMSRFSPAWLNDRILLNRLRQKMQRMPE